MYWVDLEAHVNYKSFFPSRPSRRPASRHVGVAGHYAIVAAMFQNDALFHSPSDVKLYHHETSFRQAFQNNVIIIQFTPKSRVTTVLSVSDFWQVLKYTAMATLSRINASRRQIGRDVMKEIPHACRPRPTPRTLQAW